MKKHLTLWLQRIGYGVADLGCNLIWQMLTIYQIYFYTDVMKLTPIDVGVILLATRLVDGVWDLVMGFIIDNTHTRWGKVRPYFLWGALPIALFSSLVFYVPQSSEEHKVWYAFVSYTCLSMAYTMVNMPLTAILPILTDDAKERTVLATSRILFSFVGAAIVGVFTLPLVSRFGQTGKAEGFFKTMLLYGVITGLLQVFTFFNVKEKQKIRSTSVSFKQAAKSLFLNKPWLLFAVNIVFMWGAYFLQQGALIYFFTYYVNRPDLIVTIMTITAIFSGVGTLAAPFLTPLFSKRKLFLISSAIHLTGIIIIMITGTRLFGLTVGMVISTLGFGLRHALYFSMQADPVDYGERMTGVNASGLIAAVNQFVGKITMAASGALAGFLLARGHYKPGAVQSSSALFAIQINFLYLPCGLILISMLIMSFYDLKALTPSGINESGH
ncbi:MFS transporter [Agrobacterium tumefaciens]|nr:MFS transporter [Agrobacterium tumefaciens]NTE22918.1 MFS transporter [Agrobacterium tumefaciens]